MNLITSNVQKVNQRWKHNNKKRRESERNREKMKWGKKRRNTFRCIKYRWIVAISTVYPISLLLSLFSASAAAAAAAVDAWTRFSFMNAAYFHVSNLGITLQPVYIQLHLHTKCPSAHNICTMLTVKFGIHCFFLFAITAAAATVVLFSWVLLIFIPVRPTRSHFILNFTFVHNITLVCVCFFFFLVIICCASRYSPTFSRIPFIEQPNQYRYFIWIAFFLCVRCAM